MKKLNILFFLAAGLSAQAQDTFSIVAVDSLTGELGSAGASCISADNLELYFPNDDPDFLGDLLPGIGAINTQSFYNATNQDLANQELASGKTPQQVIDWLVANDSEGDASQRQYGIAAFINGQPMAAGFTGNNCFDYKNHVTGPNYSIQGNILLGQQILDSMQARFLAAEAAGKCLADRLMEALQGAKVPGADTRCQSNGTSAMFAFIKVAKPGDDASDPTLRLFVSYNPVGIEPIDSLQALLDATPHCIASAIAQKKPNFEFSLVPNPTDGKFRIAFEPNGEVLNLEIWDANGRCILHRKGVKPNELIELDAVGIYQARLVRQDGRPSTWQKLVVTE